MPLCLLSGADEKLPFTSYSLFTPGITETLKADIKELQRNTVSKEKGCKRFWSSRVTKVSFEENLLTKD